MPELSRFFGIVIFMYRRDHAPPHLHAVYGEYEIAFMIESGEVRGDFPPRALRLVRTWVDAHRSELLEQWHAARRGAPLTRIAPLE